MHENLYTRIGYEYARVCRVLFFVDSEQKGNWKLHCLPSELIDDSITIEGVSSIGLSKSNRTTLSKKNEAFSFYFFTIIFAKYFASLMQFLYVLIREFFEKLLSCAMIRIIFRAFFIQIFTNALSAAAVVENRKMPVCQISIKAVIFSLLKRTRDASQTIYTDIIPPPTSKFTPNDK